MLCQRRIIREELRKRKVYPIIRNLDYKMEGKDEASGVILEIVNFLMRDDIPLEDDEKEKEELAEELSYAGPLKKF